LTRHLTGIGRFVARVIEALSRHRDIRLVNTVQGEHARNMRLSNALRVGQEIIVPKGSMPGADPDVRGWTRALLRGPLRKHDRRMARDCPILYTMLRPGERRFRRELGVLYDFTTMIMPELHVPETLDHFGRLYCSQAALCDNLVAISNSTMDDATWLCSCPHNAVVTSYPGPSLCVKEHVHEGQVERRSNAIIVVSTLEPRKNSSFLFRWFLNTRVLNADTELWWVGPRGWLLDRLLPRRQCGQRGRKIKLVGVVSDRELCRLYREATFSVYPSLYEGFGFPVLDSLRHGTPVAASFNSSLQEFAGPGVHYFDPCDGASLDRACQALLSAGRSTTQRADLEKRFSWDLMAENILALCA
jgi:glycosyltransferase involved in cell wall biosynthesis